MTAGVAAARREQKGGWTRYGPPSYWSKLGRSRGTRNKRDYVARQIAETGGMSMASARREVMPFLSAMTHHCQNRELTVAMVARYELETEHVAFVTGSGESTNKVQSIVEDATRLGEEATVEASEGAFEGATRDTENGTGDEEATADGDGENNDEDAMAAGAGDEDAGAAGDSQSGLGDFS
jgi:replication factor C large subunit